MAFFYLIFFYLILNIFIAFIRFLLVEFFPIDRSIWNLGFEYLEFEQLGFGI
jgi:hypothetical protein